MFMSKIKTAGGKQIVEEGSMTAKVGVDENTLVSTACWLLFLNSIILFFSGSSRSFSHERQ